MYIAHFYCDVGARFRCCASFGEGSGSVHMDDLSCLGHEERLTTCTYSSPTGNSHGNDGGVHCQPSRWSKWSVFYMYV